MPRGLGWYQGTGQMREAIKSRHREDDVYWPVTAGHVLALHAEPRAYEQKLVRFVAAAVQ